jgi:signal-transduction protein with cAMP-binding, CBS, and nucleotidyltransferase domain
MRCKMAPRQHASRTTTASFDLHQKSLGFLLPNQEAGVPGRDAGGAAEGRGLTVMDQPIRRPEEILAYRPLQQILASKLGIVWAVDPLDSVLKALQMMADKNVGLLVVLEQGALVGVISERDCARRVVLAKKSPEETPVADIMVRSVITVDLSHRFADCLRLMHQHGIRHLPVVDKGKVVAVVSIRDLLREAVTHNAKIISELERERLMMTVSMA